VWPRAGLIASAAFSLLDPLLPEVLARRRALRIAVLASFVAGVRAGDGLFLVCSSPC